MGQTKMNSGKKIKEFMLLIRNHGDSKDKMSSEQHEQFLNACMSYIEKLKKNGNLKSAQPLIRDGKMISCSKGKFTEGPYNESQEIIVGYYHILVNNIQEAIEIAKENPEFQYNAGAKIEVRPIKMKEESTSYVYPEDAGLQK